MSLGPRAPSTEDATTTGVKEEKKNEGEEERKEEKAGVTHRSVAHRSKRRGALGREGRTGGARALAALLGCRES